MDQMKTKPKGRSAKNSVKSKGNENRKPKNDRKIEKDKFVFMSCISSKLKLSSNSLHDSKEAQNYKQFNGSRTPVLMYSPFGIETPSPRVDRKHLKRSCCRQMFFSPTQKIKEDVLYLNNGIKELNLLSEGIENRFSPSNSSTSIIFDSNQSLI
ncbi:unnamed protein product [Oppiella nova]|uniref:Uncharacterized protein n=1 Tax=Oppiella nova TaxID=334625 RepID=A0A7R9LEY4_9ACAR|nr:unnamed protein product [Oppiella nova]CAG2162855.1 unnamed protein product [Oppiella nova]